MDASRIWTPDILDTIASHLPSNDLCFLRLVNKTAASHFGQHVGVSLAQPVAPWAFAEHWAQPGACRSLTRLTRSRLTISRAALSSVANLQVALAAAGHEPDGMHLQQAGAGGFLQTCLWLLERQPPFCVDWRSLLDRGASSGNREICQLCLEHFTDMPDWGQVSDDLGAWEGRQCKYKILRASYALVAAASAAARKGRVELVEWLLQQAAALSEAEAGTAAEARRKEALRTELFPAAALGCDLPALVGLWERCGLSRPHDIPSGWLYGGWRRALENALQSGRDWRAKADWLLERAAEMGQRGLGQWEDPLQRRRPHYSALQAPDNWAERLEWLKARGCRADGIVLGFALAHSTAPAVRWILADGADGADLDRFRIPDLHFSAMVAAQSGKLESLQAVQQAAGPAWTLSVWARVVDGGVFCGSLAVLNWVESSLTAEEVADCIRLSSCDRSPWSVFRSGSVQVIKWVQAHGGCTLEEHEWSTAVEIGCEAVLDFLAAEGCPMPMLGEPYEEAFLHKEWGLLPALHRAGVPFGPRRSALYASAAKQGAPPEVLRWLQAEAGVDPQAGVREAEAERAEWSAGYAERWAEEEAAGEEEVEARAGAEPGARLERRRRRRERGQGRKQGRKEEQMRERRGASRERRQERWQRH